MRTYFYVRNTTKKVKFGYHANVSHEGSVPSGYALASVPGRRPRVRVDNYYWIDNKLQRRAPTVVATTSISERYRLSYKEWERFEFKFGLEASWRYRDAWLEGRINKKLLIPTGNTAQNNANITATDPEAPIRIYWCWKFFMMAEYIRTGLDIWREGFFNNETVTENVWYVNAARKKTSLWISILTSRLPYLTDFNSATLGNFGTSGGAPVPITRDPYTESTWM